MTGSDQDKQQRERERVLSLDFECLRSIPEGLSEVRLWWDSYLKVERVGKRIDLSQFKDVLPEPETLQSITHDNIVPVVSAAKVAGFPKDMDVIEIISPFYPRGSITDALLKGERFRATEAVRITRSALNGLRELHEVHRIIHRDIKSGNILLCEGYPYAKVADLGLAGRMGDNGEVPALNNPTLYSPPEFVETGSLGQWSDIYGVGLVLRELLGGPFPYADYPTSLITERLAALQNPISPDDRLLPVWASKDLQHVFKKATARNPHDRFGSAREMDAVLARAQVADWSQVSTARWEAPTIHSAGFVAVEARWRQNRHSYDLSVKRKKRVRWVTVHEVASVSDLRSTAARKVFDQATTIACAH